jgi:hypothetical protein
MLVGNLEGGIRAARLSELPDLCRAVDAPLTDLLAAADPDDRAALFPPAAPRKDVLDEVRDVLRRLLHEQVGGAAGGPTDA